MSDTPTTPTPPQDSGPYDPHQSGGYLGGGQSYQPWQTHPVAVYQPPTNPLATTSMVLGIICVITVAAGLAELAMCILAITFASMAMGARRRHLGRKGMAQAGLILGIIGLVVYVIIGISTAGITLII